MTMRPAFLALGDSYTIGEGVLPAGCWPAQLATRLRIEGIDVADPAIIATTGWTTDELAAALDAAAVTPPFALVTLLIGANDHYRGRAPEDYREQFRALLQRAVALAGGDASRVVVVSIPDWGVTPFAERERRDAARVAREIDAFNAAAQSEAESAGARWADVTAISRISRRRSELVADGLHPSAEQYSRWVDAIAPRAREILGR